MRATLALARKDLRLLVRDKTGFFFVFFFPLLFAVFFGSISSAMSGDSGLGAIDIVLVDQDGTESSQEFVARLEQADELDVERMDSRDEAADLVRRGDKTAFVVIPEGFGEASENIFWGRPPKLELGVDPSRSAEKGMLTGALTQHSAKRMQQALSDPDAMRDNAREALVSLEDDADLPPALRTTLRTFLGNLDQLYEQLEQTGAEDDAAEQWGGFEPVSIQTADVTAADEGEALNAFAVSFPQGVLWGVLGAAAGFGISLVTERTRGTLLRLRAAPISRRQILGGKALACFITTTGVGVALMIVGRVFFGVRPDSIALLILALLCVGVCFVGIMMLLAVLGRSEASAGGIGWAVLLVLAMIGGGMIPLVMIERIPLLAEISRLSPVRWGILALEGAVWRGFTLAEIAPACAILVGIGLAAFTTGVAVFTRLERG